MTFEEYKLDFRIREAKGDPSTIIRCACGQHNISPVSDAALLALYNNENGIKPAPKVMTIGSLGDTVAN